MREPIKKILVPVDGSEASLHALQHGLDLAGPLGATVTVLEVVEEFGPLPGYYEAAPEGTDRVLWIGQQRFEHIFPALKDTSVAWDREVVEGYPAEEICRFAKEGGYQMIVMGSRGLSAVGRFVMGSVSDRVVHHAPCSVTVVR